MSGALPALALLKLNLPATLGIAYIGVVISSVYVSRADLWRIYVLTL